MKKKSIALILAAIMCVSIVGPVSSVSASDEEKTSITISYRPATSTVDDYYTEYINRTYDNWDKKDEVDLILNEYEGNDSDYLTKMELMLADDSSCGDIVYEDTFQLTADAAAGYLADISSYLDDYEAWNDGSFIEATKAATLGEDGNYYGIPATTDARGLVVNTNVLEEAGLGADWEPSTWDELFDGLYQIRDNCDGVIPFWMTLGKVNGESTSMNGYEMILYGTPDADQSLFNSTEGKWITSSECILDSNQFIVDLFEEGLTGEVSEVLDSGSDGIALGYLRDDELGMYLCGSWFPGNFAEGGAYEWDDYAEVLKFIPMPTQEGGSVTMSGGWCWSVANGSQNKDLAFEFITELMKPENYLDFIMTEQTLATIDMSDYPELFEMPFYELSESMLNSALFRPKNEQYSGVSTYIAQMTEDLTIDQDAQAAMDSYGLNVESVVGEENTMTE